jgi:drug/metabolite transporter (DMT)-like permease
MFYIFLSVCCSVIVSVLLKMAKRYQINIYQVIAWNYSIAILLTWMFLKPHLQNLQAAPFYIYSLLGLLLPFIFVVIAISIRVTGIVRTEVAQRISLFIPVIAAFLLFGEGVSTIKIIGIALGFAAIVCSVPWQKRSDAIRRGTKYSWMYLLIIFIGMGVIDTLLKQMALLKEVSFGTSFFMVTVIAFVVSLMGLFCLFATKRSKFSWPNIAFGWILGIANFGNILFYLKAHQSLSNNPSTVFTAMNIGAIVLGTFVGLLLFKEKLSNLNKAGIVLAVIAIIVISCAR